jgi:predicted nucleic acid-binding protein
MQLLDSDVVIDLVRQHPPAVEWFDTLTELPGLPGFVLMELVAGCQSVREMRVLMAQLSRLPVFWPTTSDCERALATFMRAHFSHRLGLVDAIIAECAVGLSATLCTFNVRHFGAVPGLVTEQPYTR